MSSSLFRVDGVLRVESLVYLLALAACKTLASGSESAALCTPKRDTRAVLRRKAVPFHKRPVRTRARERNKCWRQPSAAFGLGTTQTLPQQGIEQSREHQDAAVLR